MAVTKAISKDYLVTQLKNFDKEILEEKYIQITGDASYSIKKLGTATEGALATYKLTKTVGDQTVELGDAIDIPKDFLVKSASVNSLTVISSSLHNGIRSDTSGNPFPRSHLEIVLSLIPSFSERIFWVYPFLFLSSAINPPIFIWSILFLLSWS